MKSSGLSSEDYFTRANAVDLLGTIAYKLKKNALTFTESKPWVLEFLDPKINHAESLGENTAVCVECREIAKSEFVTCLDCKRVFHCHCVGSELQGMDRESEVQCACCFALRQMEEMEKTREEGTRVENGSQRKKLNTLLQQLLLNALSHEEQKASDGSVSSAWK